MSTYTTVSCDTCGRLYYQRFRTSHEASRPHRGAIRAAAKAARPTRRPSSTIVIPRRLVSFITGTGWYQGERNADDDAAELDRFARVVDSGKVARDDEDALRMLAQEADWLDSCSDDTYDPDQKADRAAARRFVAKMAELGIRP